MREVALKRVKQFKNNDRVKISKIKTLPCYIFILLRFSEKKKICIYVSNLLKQNIFRTEVQRNKFEVFIVLFILFQVLLLVIVYPCFLFLTQVIISFLYFTQIKCNFLSVKDHSFVRSFTLSEIIINLPY